MRTNEDFQKYIEPYENKIKQTGEKLHGKFLMNCRASMWRDIEKLKQKNNVLRKLLCCLLFMGGL